jgi:hypothetical protein
VWSLRASDIYQGGDTEPLLLTERAWQPSPSLDSESAKNYREAVALTVRASSKMQIHP